MLCEAVRVATSASTETGWLGLRARKSEKSPSSCSGSNSYPVRSTMDSPVDLS
jgi:hypothetical protein